MTPAEQIASAERSVAWWNDHGPFVRAESAQREKDHWGRVLWDSEYRSKWLLEEKLNRAAVRNMGLNTPEAPKREPRKFVGGELAFVGTDRAPSHAPARLVNGRRIIALPKGQDLGTRLAKIGDAHDSPLPGYQPSIASQLREYERETAEREFLEHCEEETGGQMPEHKWRKKQKADRLTRTQTEALAQRLTAAGFDCYRHDGFKLFIYWLHSRALEELPSYRRVCILPYIAAMTRAPKLAALEYFIQNNPYSRFWTFTTGPRCTVEEIPERLDWLFDKLKELNKILRARWGVEFVFRTTEFGTLEADEAGNRCAEKDWGSLGRDENARVTYHPHAHVVVHSNRGYIGKEWAKVIAFVNSYWCDENGKRVHWDAGKMIQNPRECCKYVVKPNDYEDLTDEELLAFVNALSKRRLVRCLGTLATEVRERKGKSVLRRKKIGTSFLWVEKLNHNKANTETEAEKAERINREDAYAMTADCERLARLEPPSYPGALDGGSLVDRGVSADVTKVMARIGPAAGPTPFKEPRVIVMSNLDRPSMHSVDTHPLVDRLRAQTLESWFAGRIAGRPLQVPHGHTNWEEFQNDLPGLDPSPPPDPLFVPDFASAS